MEEEHVWIDRAAFDALVAHARDDVPLECCGLLVGHGNVIDYAVRTRNLRASPSAYLVDPADHFQAIRQSRREGRDVLGAYHSHPRGPAEPSPTDIREAYHRQFLYVIVSLQSDVPAVRAYRIDAERVSPIPLRVTS